MTFLLLIMLLGLIPAFIAQSKGRSAFIWWIYGALLFIVALPHALLLSPRQSGENQLDTPARRPCPHCAEDILPAATICPFCKQVVQQQAICQRCRATTSPEAQYCTSCGAGR